MPYWLDDGFDVVAGVADGLEARSDVDLVDDWVDTALDVPEDELDERPEDELDERPEDELDERPDDERDWLADERFWPDELLSVVR